MALEIVVSYSALIPIIVVLALEENVVECPTDQIGIREINVELPPRVIQRRYGYPVRVLPATITLRNVPILQASQEIYIGNHHYGISSGIAGLTLPSVRRAGFGRSRLASKGLPTISRVVMGFAKSSTILRA
jgi:hypothetical protein